MASAFDSGIECATGTYSMSNGPSLRRWPGHDLVQIDLRRAGLGQAPRLEEADGEARRVDRRPQARPQLDERADMVLVRVGDEDAEQVLALVLDEAQVRIDEIDAGQVSSPAKPMPQSTRIHCRRSAGPKP